MAQAVGVVDAPLQRGRGRRRVVAADEHGAAARAREGVGGRHGGRDGGRRRGERVSRCCCCCCLLPFFPPGLLRVLDLRVGRGRRRGSSRGRGRGRGGVSSAASASAASAAAVAERRRLCRDREARRELDELLLGVAGVGVAPDVADVFLFCGCARRERAGRANVSEGEEVKRSSFFFFFFFFFQRSTNRCPSSREASSSAPPFFLPFFQRHVR